MRKWTTTSARSGSIETCKFRMEPGNLICACPFPIRDLGHIGGAVPGSRSSGSRISGALECWQVERDQFAAWDKNRKNKLYARTNAGHQFLRSALAGEAETRAGLQRSAGIRLRASAPRNR